jgi:hypothetical protein
MLSIALLLGLLFVILSISISFGFGGFILGRVLIIVTY